MKSLKIILVSLFCALVFGACALKTVKAPEPVSEGEKQFAKAEKKFEQGDYDKALAAYARYIETYPNDPLVPAALVKIGAIHASTRDFDGARKAYRRLIESYPKSSYASDAMVDILVTYYQEGRYSDVIQFSYDVPEDRVPSDYLIRKYAIMGDAFMMLDAPVDAADAFIGAYRRSEPREREGLILKLRKALSSLTSDELADLLARTQEEELRGFIEYQNCRNILRDGRKDEGLEALNRFIQLYGGHFLAAEAEKLKEDLTSSAYQVSLVGCLLPTSGKYESYGIQVQKGFDLAYHRMMTDYPDMDLRVVYRDTESDPERTREAVRELAEMGVCAIVGPVGTVEEAAQEAQLRGVPIMTLTGKEDITRIGDFVFRNFLTREMQVKSVVSYAFEVLGLNNFAVLYPDEKYGQDMMRLFWDEVDAYGGSIVGVEAYALDNVDFAKHIKKMIGMYYPIPTDPELLTAEDGTVTVEKPAGEEDPREPVVDFDALFIPDASEKVGLILPQLAFYDVGDVYMLGTNLWHTNKLIEMAGKDAQGTIIPDGFFAGSKRPHVRRFVSDFKSVFNETPGFIEAIGYDSAMMIFQVVKEQPVSYGVFRDRLLTMNAFDGVTGRTSVDETGDVWKSLYLLNANNRGFRELPQ